MTMQFKWPALLAPRILCDFESRSRADLTEVGQWRYAQDPSTQILCLGFKFENGTTHLWMPWIEEDVEVFFEEKVTVGRGKTKVVTMEKRSRIERQMVYRPEQVPFPQEIIDKVNKGWTVEAHAAGMERAMWYHILYETMGIPMPTRWDDTQAVCAYKGLPLKLDEVGKVLNLDVQKDKRGKDLIKLLCVPQKITKKNKAEWNNDPDLFREMGLYCMQDVEAEHALSKKIGRLTPTEYRLWVLDQTINYRGIRLDFDAVYAAKKIAEDVSVNMTAELQELTKDQHGHPQIETGNQKVKIREWLEREHQVIMPDFTSGTKKETLKDNELPPEARRVIEISQELGRTSTKKLYTMLDCVCSDERIRGLLQYHGAGTGRWSGRLVQPQNFPRPKVNGKPFKGNIEDLIAIIKFADPKTLRLCYGPEMETLAASLKGMFIAAEGHEFLASDYSSIEARIVLWLAGQDDAMDIFLKADRGEGPDIYCHLAGQIYGRLITKADADERQLGKIGVLGCGYQMGWERLQEQAKTDYELDLSEELCRRIVQTYRDSYDEVPKFWRDINHAAVQTVITGKPHTHRSITYEIVNDACGKWLACRLPNGKRIWYFNPSITMAEMPWSTKEKPDIRPKLWYEGRDNKHGGVWGLISTYGGMLTENIVQAIAREIMAEAMIRAEHAGYKIVLTVHDEILAEVLKGFGSQKEFDDLMKLPPPWAPGLPIEVEGWRGPRFKKG